MWLVISWVRFTACQLTLIDRGIIPRRGCSWPRTLPHQSPTQRSLSHSWRSPSQRDESSASFSCGSLGNKSLPDIGSAVFMKMHSRHY